MDESEEFKIIYETIIIFTDEMSKAEYDSIMTKYRRTINTLMDKILRQEKLGKKTLGYAIKKHEQGYYALFTFKGTPEAKDKLERIFKADKDVLKFMSIPMADSTEDDFDEYEPIGTEKDDDYTDEEYNPGDLLNTRSKSEQEDEIKKPVDIFNLIFGIQD